jgi:hypothetical protein
MILKVSLAKKLEKKWRFLTINTATLCQKLIITLVFKKIAIFRRKLAKIAESKDHNIELTFTENFQVKKRRFFNR